MKIYKVTWGYKQAYVEYFTNKIDAEYRKFIKDKEHTSPGSCSLYFSICSPEIVECEVSEHIDKPERKKFVQSAKASAQAELNSTLREVSLSKDKVIELENYLRELDELS